MGLSPQSSSVKFGISQGSFLGPVLFLAILSTLPLAMKIDPIPSFTCGLVGYVDDALFWVSSTIKEDARRVLEVKAKVVVAYITTNFIHMKQDKAQIPWVDPGSKEPNMAIDESIVAPVQALRVLGRKFNWQLKLDSHIRTLISASAAIALTARHHTTHSLAGRAAEVVRALPVGKVGYEVAAAIFPHLWHEGPHSPSSQAYIPGSTMWQEQSMGPAGLALL